jgi:hypothetical protein
MASSSSAVLGLPDGCGRCPRRLRTVTWMPGVLLRRRVEARLLDVGTFDEVIPEATIIKRENRGPLPALDRLAARTSSGSALVRFIEQSGARLSPSGLLMLSVVGRARGVSARLCHRARLPGLHVGLVLGLSVPFLVLAAKRKSADRKFEELFPRRWSWSRDPSVPATRSPRRWALVPRMPGPRRAGVPQDIRPTELRSAAQGCTQCHG